MDINKPKVLIVDDERFYINILIELLSEDYNIVVSKNAEQAFDLALDAPDLILLDIMMPDKDGYEVCKLLKADDRTHEIPVIFLTVRNELNDEVKGFNLGAVDYISKPISPSIVKSRVATHISLHNARKILAQKNNTLLTENTLIDEQLRRSQKLDGLGKLTGGIAHDFNNILGIIFGYSDLLHSELESNDKLKKYAEQIMSASERGQKITQKLLSFSRKKSSKIETVNINKMLTEQQHMLQKLLTVSINLTFDLEKNLWETSIDKSDLEDAILNICINAKHAMSNNGNLILKTNNIVLSSSHSDILNIASGEYVSLSISDNGTGMSQETLDKLFDPFFTTKGNKGTGLGMSQVHGFIERSYGAINVDSRLNEGTCIALYFPKQVQTKIQITQKLEDIKQYGGNETILVVDDEEALRNLICEILEKQKYHVLCAENAENAIDILKINSVDLLLTDVLMPGINGYELALKVKTMYPNIKIQIMSGFNDNGHDNTEYEDLYKKSLKKPIKNSRLLSCIRENLDNE